MKTPKSRRAISQSLDLFIIIAAVLGIGGIVTGAAYSLANGAATSTSIQVVQGATAGGSSTSINAFSITIKNTGTSTITCTAAAPCEVILVSTKQGTTAVTTPAPSGSTSSGASAGWSIASATSPSPVTFSTSTMTLSPGAQVSLTEGNLVLTGGVGYTTGTVVTVSVLFGPASAQINLVAQ